MARSTQHNSAHEALAQPCLYEDKAFTPARLLLWMPDTLHASMTVTGA